MKDKRSANRKSSRPAPQRAPAKKANPRKLSDAELEQAAGGAKTAYTHKHLAGVKYE